MQLTRGAGLAGLIVVSFVEVLMFLWSRRSLFASALMVGLLPTGALFAADKPSTINIDWATYNPVSMILKDKGWLEKEFEKDGIKVRWVQTLGSNKALEFLNAGSIDFGSTAGSAALVAKINGNPIKAIYVYSRPELTALVTRKDSAISKIADLKGKRVADEPFSALDAFTRIDLQDHLLDL
jgi:sulfonate transport system substrate-binding protein